MRIEIRKLVEAEHAAQFELLRVAFGIDRGQRERWLQPRAARWRWGVFDGGRLVASAVDLAQGHWFGGAVVPASGVGAVVVAPERRRGGFARQVLTALLADAHERGAVISTLFPTTPQLYRALGYESVGQRTWTGVPATAFGGVRMPEGVIVRPADPADVPALFDLYREAARESAGMLDRSSPRVDASPEAVLGRYDGISVATGPDGIEGYAAWDRRGGYDDSSGAIGVHDLFTRSVPAAEALLFMLGGWAAVTPALSLCLAPADPIRLIAPLTNARVDSTEEWMLRVLDAPGAVAARGWPTHLSGSADLELEDDTCPWNAGRWRLTLEHGTGRLEPGGAGTTRLPARGFGPLYAGAAIPATLRRAGLLAGGDERTDAFLQAATAGPAPALLDYF